jgi:hypothetical protein
MTKFIAVFDQHATDKYTNTKAANYQDALVHLRALLLANRTNTCGQQTRYLLQFGLLAALTAPYNKKKTTNLQNVQQNFVMMKNLVIFTLQQAFLGWYNEVR